MNIEKNRLLCQKYGGIGLLFLSVLLIAIGGLTDLIPSIRIQGVQYGVLETFAIIGQALIGKVYIGWVFFSIFILLIDILVLGVLLVLIVIQGKKELVYPVLVQFLAIAYAAYLVTLITSEIERGIIMQGGIVISYFASIFLFVSLYLNYKEVQRSVNNFLSKKSAFIIKNEKEKEKTIIQKQEIRKEVQEEVPVAKNKSQPYFNSEEAIRNAIKREIEAIEKENRHASMKVRARENSNVMAPNREKEHRSSSESGDDEDEDRFAKFGARRKLSFEKRLSESEESLRKQYYALRDYIKGYGINNRVSRKGDTFSFRRKRYVFLTISGKHIKAFFALDPKDYDESTFPVKENEKKKYEDLPLLLFIRSGLSYRRALSLVDDLMAKEGIKKWRAIH